MSGGVYGNGVFNEAPGSPFTGASATTDGLSGSVPQPLAGDQLKFLKGDGTWAALAAPTGYQMVADEGVILASRNTLNFIGASVTATDDTAQNRTNITITPSAFPFSHANMSLQLVPNMGYTVEGSGVQYLTLPATVPYGSIIEIIGTGEAGWKVIQNAGQKIIFSKSTTTTGTSGYANSTDNTDCVRLVCIKDNTTFAITNAVGTINII